MILVNFIRFGFLIWCTLVIRSHAAALDKRLEPKGALKMRLDHHLATTWPTPLVKKGPQIRRSFLWSTHIRFMEPVSAISNGQLFQIAFKAYDEMEEEYEPYAVKKDKDKPKAVSVLAFGNEIIISSSMKGSMPFAYTVEDSPAAKILVECQKTWVRGGGAEGTTHKNDAGCAEVWVTQLYYNTHTTALKDQNARIAAIVSSGGNPPVARYPCATGSNVSCER